MKKLFLLTSLLVIWITITSYSTLSDFDCTSVHTGHLYQYKNGTQLYSTIIREDSLQTEINSQTGDTTYWKIRWTDNCTFTTTYLSGLKAKSEQELDFYRQTVTVIKIRTVTQTYFTYDAELKNKYISKKISDTAWRRLK